MPGQGTAAARDHDAHSRDRVRIALVEDHVIVREALAIVLTNEGFEIVLQAGDAESAAGPLLALEPAAAIIDIGLPGDSGVQLAKRVAAEAPSIAVVLFTGTDDPRRLAEATACGARGLVLKSADLQRVVRALRSVVAGGTYVDPSLRSLLLERATTHAVGALSPREREVLDLISQGHTVEGVAAVLVIAPDTVRTHIRNAIRHLEAENRTHAIALALRSGEIAL